MKLAIVLSAFLLSGCALFPANHQEIADGAKTQGCNLASIDANDAFSWRFLGFSSNRTTRVTCHKDAQ